MDANSMEYELSGIDLHNALSITSFTSFIKCHTSIYISTFFHYTMAPTNELLKITWVAWECIVYFGHMCCLCYRTGGLYRYAFWFHFRPHGWFVGKGIWGSFSLVSFHASTFSLVAL